MKIFFPHSTGSDSFEIAIKPTGSIIGELSFGFGCNGFTGNVIDFSFKNGELKDSIGAIVGSCDVNETITLSGNYFNTGISYYINNNLISTIISTPNRDINYFEVNKTGANFGYEFNYKISNRIDFNTKRGLYLTTNTGVYTNYFELISGMINNIDISSGQYSGISVDSKSEDDYDLIIFGYNSTGEYYQFDTGFWSTITKPIIFIGAEQAGQNGAGIISGTTSFFNHNSDYHVFVEDSEPYSNINNENIRRMEMSGTSLFLLPYKSGYYFNYSGGIHILRVEEEFVNILTEINYSNYVLSQPSNKRLIFNDVISGSGTGSEYYIAEDNRRKLITNMVYNIFN